MSDLNNIDYSNNPTTQPNNVPIYPSAPVNQPNNNVPLYPPVPIVNNNVPLNPQESFMNNNVPINSQVPIIQQNSNVQVAPQASIVQPGFQPVYFNSNPPTYEQSIDNNVILNSTSFTTTTPTSEFSQNQSKVNTSTRNQEVVLM